MKININSWHYKFYKLGYLDDPPLYRTNLCQYMRRLFMTPFILLFVFIMVFITVPFVIISRLVQIIAMLPFGYRPTGVWFDKNTKWFSDLKFTPVQSKQQSIITEWLKAKKEKVCPLIEFEG